MYGEASGTIWLDNLVCTGSETSITQCQSKGWGVHNCGHSEDVAISCSSGQFSGSLRTQINTMPLESCKFLVYRKTPRNYICLCIFVSTVHSLNFVLGDQVSDIEFYQTNLEMQGFETAQNTEIGPTCMECIQRMT